MFYIQTKKYLQNSISERINIIPASFPILVKFLSEVAFFNSITLKIFIFSKKIEYKLKSIFQINEMDSNLKIKKNPS